MEANVLTRNGHPPKSKTAGEILREEYTFLHGSPYVSYSEWVLSLPPDSTAWRFQTDHLKDPIRFVARLKDAGDRAASALLSSLSTQTREALAHQRLNCPPSEDLIATCLADLNRILDGLPIAILPEHFTIAVSADLQAKFRDQQYQGRSSVLRRLLLEAAFPDCIASVDTTLAGVYGLIHQGRRTAICLSGGGIRSATFGLGVLQGLARHQMLRHFDYLSTVSGGGYIGSWLSAWIHHEGGPGLEPKTPRNVESVEKRLASVDPTAPIDREPEQLQHLRAYSNYLTPRLGLFSADTWTLVATYLRNLLLNWLVFLPMLLGVLMIPRLWIALLHAGASEYMMWCVGASGFLLGAWGIAYSATERPSGHRERTAQPGSDQEGFLLHCLLPLCGMAACFTTFLAWLLVSKRSFSLPFLEIIPGVKAPEWWHFVFSGVAMTTLGWLIHFVRVRRLRKLELAAVVFTGSLGGLVLGFVVRAIFSNPDSPFGLALYVAYGAPLVVFVFLLTATFFIGLTSRYTSDDDNEWWARMGAWLMIVMVAWSVFASIVLFVPVGLLKLPKLWGPSLGGLAGWLTLWLARSDKTPGDAEADRPDDLRGRLSRWVLSLAAPLFVALLIGFFSLATSWAITPFALEMPSDPLTVVYHTPLMIATLVSALLIALGLLFSNLFNINKFSLHAIYRNRLVRAYLGASNPHRRPNPFTGFDPWDNLRFQELHQRPLHIVNLALNLVSGENLAWQQRKAESFTASALHAGSFRLGYRPVAQYALNRSGKGLSLGTAVTISGAAASPNMGYHSSPVVAFLMTLFNIRLGGWLGNPGPAGDRTFHDAGPRSPFIHFIKEAFGLTGNTSPYVYLSDGGHFENLGLYEMIFRRCHLIVLSDGGCDPDCSLEDLGNALRKIRIDLGVPIHFERFQVYSRRNKDVAANRRYHYAMGYIDYPKVDGPHAQPGVIIYLKPAITGDESQDVFNYVQVNELFPHEPTGDQWFSESQFESYRALGEHTASSVFGPDWSKQVTAYDPASPFYTLIKQALKNVDQPATGNFLALLQNLLPK